MSNLKPLSYQTLADLGEKPFLLRDAPEKVIQFGEGNFMRAFIDAMIDHMNESAGFGGKVVLVQPIPPFPASDRLKDTLNAQEGLYTLYLRGRENGRDVNRRRVVSCVSRCLNACADYDAVMACADNPDLRFIASNTTEAGIRYDPACRFEDRPASSWPGKLTQFLHRRWERFGSEKGKGFVILACELIDDNGRELERCVRAYAEQWGLEADFLRWLSEENLFCSTLVDRIVTGYPRTEADALNEASGYVDGAMDTAEPFGLYVIEAPQWLRDELPVGAAGFPVVVTDDHKPYKTRKVRILNGAHTSFVLGAYLAGRDIVRDCMADDAIRGFLERAVEDEIIPTLSLPREELESFAASVADRFRNPFIDHKLLDISLNSTSKWKARVMPSLLGYVEKYGRVPPRLAASFAFYLAFYRGESLDDTGLRARRPDGTEYLIRDDADALAFHFAHRADPPAVLARATLAHQGFWGRDLTGIPGLADAVAADLETILERGARALFEELAAT